MYKHISCQQPKREFPFSIAITAGNQQGVYTGTITNDRLSALVNTIWGISGLKKCVTPF